MKKIFAILFFLSSNLFAMEIENNMWQWEELKNFFGVKNDFFEIAKDNNNDALNPFFFLPDLKNYLDPNYNEEISFAQSISAAWKEEWHALSTMEFASYKELKNYFQNKKVLGKTRYEHCFPEEDQIAGRSESKKIWEDIVNQNESIHLYFDQSSKIIFAYVLCNNGVGPVNARILTYIMPQASQPNVFNFTEFCKALTNHHTSNKIEQVTFLNFKPSISVHNQLAQTIIRTAIQTAKNSKINHYVEGHNKGVPSYLIECKMPQ